MNTKTITRTAILIALLIALQAATRPLANQFVTGSCVNLVLAVAAMLCGVWSGVIVAIVSPFFAYFLGISPQLWLAPAIACGNAVLVVILALLSGKFGKAGGVVSVIVAAVCKFVVLYVVVVKLFIPMGNLPAKVAAQFSWPQLVTALIGGFLALAIVPTIRKAIKE
jgi:hypothetical protein